MQNVLPLPATEELAVRQPGAALASYKPTTIQLAQDLTIVLDTSDRYNREAVETIAAALAS